VTQFEKEHARPNAATLTVIRQAFERAGVEFANYEVAGVPMSER
jgi:hypothetical protein